MRLATFFHNSPSIPIEDDTEFNVTFNPDKNNFARLQERIIEGGNRRINIFWDGTLDVDKIKILKHLNENLHIRLVGGQVPWIEELQKNEIKYFFDRTLMIHSYILLEGAIALEPTDIYISDDLCFNLPDVAEICHSHNINLRIVLNKIPSINPISGSCFTGPIFRPEDFDILNLYFDTAEFDCSDTNEPFNELECKGERLPIYYRRWFETHEGDAELKYLNTDINIDFPNNYIPKELTEYKIKCKHRCTMNALSLCHKCQRLLGISYRLKERFEDERES